MGLSVQLRILSLRNSEGAANDTLLESKCGTSMLDKFMNTKAYKDENEDDKSLQ